MSEDLVKNAPARAMRNRKILEGSCGCYRCLETFNVEEIKDWTDGNKTALCPKCGIDSVLNTTDKELLKTIQTYWMIPTNSDHLDEP
jgi:hypothetical protein